MFLLGPCRTEWGVAGEAALDLGQDDVTDYVPVLFVQTVDPRASREPSQVFFFFPQSAVKPLY